MATDSLIDQCSANGDTRSAGPARLSEYLSELHVVAVCGAA
jgi:hypothetical protein